MWELADALGVVRTIVDGSIGSPHPPGGVVGQAGVEALAGAAEIAD